jgi:hypothetical protein
VTDPLDFITIMFRYLRSLEGHDIERDHDEWHAAFGEVPSQILAEALMWHARNIGETATIKSVRRAIACVTPGDRGLRYSTIALDERRIALVLEVGCSHCGAIPGSACDAEDGQVHVSRWLWGHWRTEPRRMDANDMFAAQLYAAGESPLAVTEKLIEIHMDMVFHVVASRVTEPRAFPGVEQLTPIGEARKLIAALMAAGWMHPDLDVEPPREPGQ